MTVNQTTGEIVADLDAIEARAITNRIKEAAESIWSLLLEAHERRAWAVLGYRTWADYVGVEFDMSRTHSYALLDQGRVTREIEAASGVSYASDIREARDLKPVMAEVKADIAEAVKDVPADQPDVVTEKVRSVVDRHRTAVRSSRPAAPTVEAPSLGDMNRDARATPSYLGSKAFEQLLYVRKLVDQAGGVRKIVADLEGDMGAMAADNWVGGIEGMRDLLDDWVTRLRRRSITLAKQ